MRRFAAKRGIRLFPNAKDMDGIFNTLATVAHMLHLRALAFRRSYCPLCRRTTLFVRLDHQHVAVRCSGCRASAVTLSLISALADAAPGLGSMSAYELSARGPLFAYLQARARSLAFSEYFQDVPRGEFRDGIQCQDVQRLTYPDESFDLCTSTEVFEHVPDDRAGFAELLRVLRPGGWLVFTVPLDGEGGRTVERARIAPDGTVEHLLPPEYHGDPIRTRGRILAFRNYGDDIADRLLAAGFVTAQLVTPKAAMPWGLTRRVIVARKGGHAAANQAM